jgi:GAF domain-containing protein
MLAGMEAQIRLLEDRLRILSGSLRAFAEATADYAHLMDVVAQTLAEVVGDGCVVRMLSGNGWLDATSIHLPITHLDDPAAIARVRAHVSARHHLIEQAAGRSVIETGESLLVPQLDLDAMRATATPEIVDVYRTIGIHSLLMVALRVRGESIGLLSMVRYVPGSRPFDRQDRHLAQALADHAALAISNGRLMHQLEQLLTERTDELKTLRGMLPICAWCKRIQDDKGAWAQLEAYVSAHTEAVFTHGICPDCVGKLRA